MAAAVACGPLLLPGSPVAAADPVSATMTVKWTRPGVAGTFVPPATLRVGDEVTISFELTGFLAAGCNMFVNHIDAGASMSAGQGESSVGGVGVCRPWTFIVPPVSSGTLIIDGFVHGDDTELGDASVTPPLVEVQLVSGGTHRPYASTYPTPSWAPIDLLGMATPSFEAPLVVSRPPGATRLCGYGLSGSGPITVTVRSFDYETCDDWEVTVPDLRAEAVSSSPFGLPWEGTLSVGGGTIDPISGATLGGSALTPMLTWDGAGGDVFASNLPALVFPEPSHPRYVLTGSTITVNPLLTQVDADGTCRIGYNTPFTPPDGLEVIVPMTGGACEPFSFEAAEPGVYQIGVQLDVNGEPGPSAGYRVDVVDPMPAPTLEIETPVVDQPFNVTSSVGGGVPSAFDISLQSSGAGQSLAMSLVAGPSSCASGALDFLNDERSVAEACTPTTAGQHELTIAYQDVTGAARTRSRTITVLAFPDIVGSTFALDITWLALEGITSGCGATSFCPDGFVTRGQMAAFLSRALSLPATTRDYFTDDETNQHEAAINRLRAAGITAGCSETRFCPDGLVTRAQMATFLARAFHLPASSTDYFTDDDTSMHEAAINSVRAAGITSGCGATRYCPDGMVTRGQMAAFLHRAMTD